MTGPFCDDGGLAATAMPSEVFGEEFNAALVQLRTMAYAMSRLMDNYVAAAKTNPETVEAFLIAVGPAGYKPERSIEVFLGRIAALQTLPA